MVQVEVKGAKYYLNPRLKKIWDNLKDGNLSKLDEDRVYITDGRERTGKSVFTIQQAAYIDPTIIEGDLPRITFTPKDTLYAIRNTKSNNKATKAIIFDEAFRGMSSKGALSKTNKKITQAMMEMGQNNLVLFIVSPTFFLLELYSAMLRSEALFHIVKEKVLSKGYKKKRRFFRAFNYQKKAHLYKVGVRKGWNYNIRTNLRDHFSDIYPGGDEFEKKYRKKKFESLKKMDDEEKERVDKYYLKFGLLSRKLKDEFKYPFSSQADYLTGCNHKIDSTTISRIVAKIPMNNA